MKSVLRRSSLTLLMLLSLPWAGIALAVPPPAQDSESQTADAYFAKQDWPNAEKGYAVIVAAEPVTSVDVTSADILVDLWKTLSDSQIELRFAEMKDPVKDKLRRFELLDKLGTDIFYPTVGAAIDAYLAEHAVDWKP